MHLSPDGPRLRLTPIPGFIISLLTFPGVIVHEWAHKIACNLFDVAVFRVVYFKLDFKDAIREIAGHHPLLVRLSRQLNNGHSSGKLACPLCANSGRRAPTRSVCARQSAR
jgi:hypothetical protein